MIRVENLTKEFSSGLMGKYRTIAVNDVSFEIKEGEIVSLIGESGSGKTTIGKMILRILKPTKGKIFLNGEDIYNYKPQEFYRKVQGVFQDPFSSFNPIYKVDRVFDVVYESLLNRKKMDRDEVERALMIVGLNPKDVLGKYPHQLSGGQLQRVLIARALVIGARFLVADEIISMLDASTRIDVLNVLGELKKSRKMSILFITHDLSLGYYISDKILIIYKGHIVEAGDTRKVFSNPLHPYTKMLFSSVPTINKKWEEKEVEYVEEDRKIEKENVCPYYPRCQFKAEKCFKKPELVKYEKDHYVACTLYDRR